MNAIKVEVNEPRLQQFVYVVKGGGRETRTLRPGVNLVPKDVVDQMRKNVAFMAKTQPGSKSNAREGDPDSAVTIHDGELPAEAATTLEGMKVGDAMKLVYDTLDKSQLEAWKATAKSARVLAAIDNQLVKIDATLVEPEKE